MFQELPVSIGSKGLVRCLRRTCVRSRISSALEPVVSRLLDRASDGQAREHIDAHYDIVEHQDAERSSRLARVLQAGPIIRLEQ